MVEQHQEWAQHNHHHFTDHGIRILLEKGKKKEKANRRRPAAGKKQSSLRYPTDRTLDKHSITIYSTENEEKSIVVERWNRTIKQRVW